MGELFAASRALLEDSETDWLGCCRAPDPELRNAERRVRCLELGQDRQPARHQEDAPRAAVELEGHALQLARLQRLRAVGVQARQVAEAVDGASGAQSLALEARYGTRSSLSSAFVRGGD